MSDTEDKIIGKGETEQGDKAEQPEKIENNKNESHNAEKEENIKSDNILEHISPSGKQEYQVQYHFENCIVPQGGLGNLLVNSGKIEGNINQSNSNYENDSSKKKVIMLTNEVELDQFFEEYKSKKVLSGMLILTMLEIVPETMFWRLCRMLEDELTAFEEKEEQPDIENNVFESIHVVLKALQAERVPASLITDAGRTEIKCIVFKEPQMAEELREKIWEDHLSLRDPIVDWMFSLKAAEDIRNILDYQIVNGFVNIAGLDFVYTMEKVIKKFACLRAKDDIRYAAAILEELKNKPEYQENISNLLCTWLREEDSKRWRIPYQIHDTDDNKKMSALLGQKLMNVLKADSRFKRNNYGKWYLQSRGYLLYPAHLKKAVSEQLLKTLGCLFQEAASYSERNNIAQYFTILFREDYYYTYPPELKMIFIDACNQKEMRNYIKRLLLFAWQTKDHREIIQHILKLHLAELDQENTPWEYMKGFLKTVAFTGEKLDFENTKWFLEKDKSDSSHQAVSWICDLVNKRMKG